MLSLLRAQSSHMFVIEGSFICHRFYQWLVLRVLRGLLAVLLPAALVVKVMALEKGLYLCDCAMRVHIAMVEMIDSGYFADSMGHEPGEETMPEPRANKVVLFEEFFTAGLRMPPHPVLAAILFKYQT
jgi:hypothetical protein